jgi:hypothetical protein
VKEPNGPWHLASQEEALDAPLDIRRYALGEMILQRSSGSVPN